MRSRLSPLHLVAAATMLLLPSLAVAEAMTFAVDPVHSEVGFRIRHIVANVPGRFSEFTGSVAVDPAMVEQTLKIRGTVKTASIDTGNEKRDAHLKSADFFEVETYPEMTFVSKGVAKDGDTYRVTGDLTMRGVTKEVVMEAEIGGFATNPFTGTPTTGIDLEGVVNRKDFGMVWNKALDQGGVMLGDDVRLAVHLEATVAPKK